MSGGRLVVLDRAGRENKHFNVPSGLVTLGSDPSCDVRILLPTVESHHATIVVHTKETVIHNVGSGETLVNGTSVSVVPLRQDDVVSLGGRELRWRYTHPTPHHTRQLPHTPVLQRVRRVRGRVPARRSEAPPTRAANAPHRNSTPGAVSARQVAIVQPQRRDTSNKTDAVLSPTVSIVTNIRRRRTSKSDTDMNTSVDKSGENRAKPKYPKNSQVNLQNTTKATLWIESRKTSPRKSVKESPSRVEFTPKRALSTKKSTPLRMTVLKKAQSAHKTKVTKIEAPSTIDHTKQAAIMLMTGHTPRKKTSPRQTVRKTPSLVVKKQSPVNSRRKSGRGTKNVSPNSVANRTGSASPYKLRNASEGSQSISVIEIHDSVIQESLDSNLSASTSGNILRFSNQKKSALKDPAAKKNPKKSESIKFDLSNLKNQASNSMDVLTITDVTQRNHVSESSDDEMSLHYSDSSPGNSPSPRKPINSRSNKILENTLGLTITINTEDQQQILTPESPRSRKSLRGSMMLQKVLQSPNNTTVNSNGVKMSDQSSSSENVTSRLLDKNKMESYSIVDLVSNDSSQSIYNSMSDMSMMQFNTPLTRSERNTRSLTAESLPASSTPLKCNVMLETARSQSLIEHHSNNTTLGIASISQNLLRRSKSLSTPVNLPDNETFFVNSGINESQSHLNTKNVSRTGVSTRKAYNTSTVSDNSKENVLHKNFRNSLPKNNDTFIVSMKGRKTKSLTAPVNTNSTRKSNILNNTNLANTDKTTRSMRSSTGKSPLKTGFSTPENHNSPEELGTPVLRIQSLLDGTVNSTIPQRSKKGVSRMPLARKTISGRWSTPRKRGTVHSTSFIQGSRASLRRSHKPSVVSFNYGNAEDLHKDNGDTTPKSAVKLIQEAVKNKHSTAKQPKSKRSIIDNLNESDIVKQLFNSPVKRKLSQSMIEFSKKQILDDEATPPKHPTRHTIALVDRTSDDSIMEQTHAFTPEVFVSPLSTPSNSHNLAGLKRLFAKTTPENDLRDVRGVRKLLRTPRNTKYVKNSLTDVAGVKLLFERSPRNSLSDVRIKSLFAASPKNDLRRVTGVRTLYRSHKKNGSPKNDLGNTALRDLFINKSPRKDLRNVSGVKATMRAHSPKTTTNNNLSDFEGVRNIFRRERDVGLNNISGIEELFSESQQAFSLIDSNAESSFDLLIGKPAVKAYPKAKSLTHTSIPKPKVRQGNSLKTSFNLINDDVSNWLEIELSKRMPSGDRSQQSSHYNENNSASTPNSRISEKNTKSITRNMSRLITKTTGNTFDNDFQSISDQSKASSGNAVSKTKELSSGRKSRTINKVTPAKSLNRSKTKANLPRELLKLATDSVEGNTPVLASRIRNSSLNKVTELKKSTSEIYGAHTLPIKKRSLVDTSKKSREKNTLPIKKRVVMHSTPVKSRFNATASTFNVTGIGNVSPIATMDETRNVNTAKNTDTTKTVRKEQDLPRQDLKSKPQRTRKNELNSVDVQIEFRSTHLSTRNKEPVTFSPIQTRRTKSLKTKSIFELSNMKKRKKSLLITKKSPDYNPNLSKSGAMAKTNSTKVLRRNNVTQTVLTVSKKTAINKRRRKIVQDKQSHEKEKTNISTSNQQSIVTRSTRRQAVALVQIPEKVIRAKPLKGTSPQSKSSPSKSSKLNVFGNSPVEKLRKMRGKVTEVNKPKKSELTETNNKVNLVKNQARKGNRVTQNTEVSGNYENVKTHDKSEPVPKKKKIDKNLTPKEKKTEQIKEKIRQSRRGKKTVTQAGQDVIEACESRTRSTRNTVANKNQTGNADLKDTMQLPKPVTETTTVKGRKRKLVEQKSSEESAAKLRKSDIHDDIPRSNRRRKIESESNAKIEQNTRNRRMNKNDKSASNEITNGGQSTNGNKVTKINSRIIKTKAGQNNTNNKTDVSEQNVESKREGTRNTSNTKPKPIVPEASVRTTRRNKIVEPEQPQTRQPNRKRDNSVAVTKNAPELPKKVVISEPVMRVTRARAVVDEVNAEQKPAIRSRRR